MPTTSSTWDRAAARRAAGSSPLGRRSRLSRRSRGQLGGTSQRICAAATLFQRSRAIERSLITPQCLPMGWLRVPFSGRQTPRLQESRAGMVDRVARVVAVSGISLLALVACSTDDSPSSAPATVAASIEQDSPEPAPTTPELEPDPLPACAALFDGGAESIVQRVPNLLIELPESLDSTSAQPYMVMDSELRAVTDLAPSTMHDPIETMRAPFGEIAAALTSGGDALNSDTSGVDAAVSELVEQCTDAGFTIEDVDESPYGETVTSSRGNLLKEVDQLAAIVASSGDPLIEFAVKDIVVDFQCTSGYVEAPVNDHYIGLNFEITTTPELIDEP